MTVYEYEDRIGALKLDLERLKKRASILWSEAFQQVESGEWSPEQAERWRAVTDAMLKAWIEDLTPTHERVAMAQGVVTQIIDNS